MLLKTTRHPITITLIILNISVFAIMVYFGVHLIFPQQDSLINWGANCNGLTFYGQPWRLVTSMFLHSGITHLFANMFALWRVGYFLEDRIGSSALLALYFTAGLGGNFASSHFNIDTVSVGASGAIFGLFGGLLISLLLNHDFFVEKPSGFLFSTLLFFGDNFGFNTPGIDCSAHIGGAITGLLFSFYLNKTTFSTWTRRFYSRREHQDLLEGTVFSFVIIIATLVFPLRPSFINSIFPHIDQISRLEDRYIARIKEIVAHPKDLKVHRDDLNKNILPKVKYHAEWIINTDLSKFPLTTEQEKSSLAGVEGAKKVLQKVEVLAKCLSGPDAEALCDEISRKSQAADCPTTCRAMAARGELEDCIRTTCP